MSEKIIIDPEIKSLIPPLTDEERQQLELNLKAHGCRDPLTVWDGPEILLDGHNRKQICDANGIGYRISKISLPDRTTALTWVIFNQLGRRNLNGFQRAELALAHRNIVAGDARRRMLAGKPPEDDLTQNLARNERQTDAIIGSVADVSRGTIQSVRKIKEKAEPEIAAMARKGDVSIDAAAKVATLPKAAQKAVAAAGPKAVKEKAKQIREGKTESDAEPEILDECGKPVDGKLLQIFTDAKRFDEAINLLNQISRTLGPLLDRKDGQALEAGRWLESPLIEKALREMRFALKNARPHAPCVYPNCGPKCPACMGKKWLPTVRWNETPDLYKKRAGRGGK